MSMKDQKWRCWLGVGPPVRDILLGELGAVAKYPLGFQALTALWNTQERESEEFRNNRKALKLYLHELEAD